MKAATPIAVAFLAVTLMLTGVVAAQQGDDSRTRLSVVPVPEPDEAYDSDAVASDCGSPSCCDESDCCAEACCDLSDCCYCPRWTFTAGALIMDRSAPDDAVLVDDPQQPGGPGLMNASEFDFDWRGGWEVGAIRHNVRCTCWDLEARYFRIDGWRAVWGVVDTQVGLLSGTYDSHLDGFELNLRRSVGCGWLTVLGGFRFVELDESAAVFTDTRLVLTTARAGAVNDLYGFQLGADARLWGGCWLAWDAKVRAGVYGNEAATTVMSIQPGVPNLSASAEDSHTAFLGELGLTGTVQLVDCLALRAGYQLMWLEGVALAPDQFAVADPTTGLATVDTSGGALYHGVVISLEYTR